MKKILKFYSISFFVLLSFVLAGPVFAIDKTSPTKTNTPKVIVLADVNIYNIKIISQEINNIKISFDIKNNQKAQAGLKYGVKLVKETANGQTLSDEYVYPEIFDISENTTLKKEITYTAPNSLAGDYKFLLTIQNESGSVLSLGSAGDVKLVSTGVGIEIIPESCSLSVALEKGNPKYILSQGVDIDPKENLNLVCTFVNNGKNSISVIPTYETHFRSMGGDIVKQQGGDITPITLSAQEKKEITLTLPKALDPQSYDIKVSLKSGSVNSNSIIVHYVLHGVSATINNFSLDKDYYKKGDIAKLSFLLSPSADRFPGSRLKASSIPSVVLTVSVVNDNKKDCINPINQTLTQSGFIELPFSIITDCKNPQASIQLKDTDGKTLDQKNFAFESRTISTSQNIRTILIVLGILIVAGFAFYFINLKKESNETIINQ
jgi:hypothetical protein